MDYLLTTYLAYVFISVLLTIWVGRTLFTNGKVFLMGIFHGDELLVDSVNKLLLIGFYLINFGYALRNLIVRSEISSMSGCVEMLSLKIGVIIIILGIMHFFNLLILFVMRSKARRESMIVKENPA